MGIFKRNDNREKTLNNIWLAGLGAYAKSTEEVSQLSGKGRSLFDELIERGREVEQKSQEPAQEAQSKATAHVESRLHKVVQKVTGLDNTKLENVDAKLDALTAQVEALLNASQQTAEKEAEEAEEAEAKKPVAKKPAVRKNVARRKTATAASNAAA